MGYEDFNEFEEEIETSDAAEMDEKSEMEEANEVGEMSENKEVQENKALEGEGKKISFGQSKESIEHDIKKAKDNVEYYGKLYKQAVKDKAEGWVGTQERVYKNHMEDELNKIKDLERKTPDPE